ncbi:MAG: response regulator [Symploca sp. SIO2B6]|nr:response regulator [Symploca sp. SIO2B6]
MQSEQQRIMGYFIEEAKDHLNTIEQGILNLQSTIEEVEIVNEVFRAVHSLKGGAALLGLNSLQKRAHYLEDCFKILIESQISADNQLESLFLQALDTLKELVEELQKPLSVTEETTSGIINETQSVGEELKNYLQKLVDSGVKTQNSGFRSQESGGNSTAPIEASRKLSTSVHQNPQALPVSFKTEVLLQLRQMLQLFKQQDLPENRQALQEHCLRLLSLGEQFDLPSWCNFIETSRAAIACTRNSYAQLANLVIKEIKQAQELILANRSVEIAPSPQLRALVPEFAASGSVTAPEVNSQTASKSIDLEMPQQNGNARLPNSGNSPDIYHQQDKNSIQPQGGEPLGQQNFTPEENQANPFAPTQNQSGHYRAATPIESESASIPQVGITELNTLADIFEGQTRDLEETWQEEEIISLDEVVPSPEAASSSSEQEQQEWDELIGELDNLAVSGKVASANEDLMAWLGDDTLEELVPEPQQAMTSAHTSSKSDARVGVTEEFSDLLFESDSFESSAKTVTDTDYLSSLFGEDSLGENSSAIENKTDISHEKALIELGLGLNSVEQSEALPEVESLQDLFAADSETAFKPEPEIAQPKASAKTEQLSKLPALQEPESGKVKFNQLEAMLDDKQLLALPETLKTPTSKTKSASAEADVFTELELFLNEQTPIRAEQATVPSGASVPTPETIEDEFKDLEKLLEQVDQIGRAKQARVELRQPRPVGRPRSLQVREQTMRVPVKHLDSLSNLVGELVVNRNSLEQDQERLRQFLDNLQNQVSALSDVGARMRDLYERSLLESSLLASRHNHQSAVNSGQSSLKEHGEEKEYHPLEMDRFTGFHLLSQEMIELIVQVRESASDVGFLVDETDQVARILRQVTTQLQEGLTRSRMVPFAYTADRLPRAVRDISLKLGKKANLYVEGREVLIDKMILEHLFDPLIHLVNNALTHGIEPPAIRQAAGKQPAGTIILRAFQQGNQTVISISDDGAGIDPERVRNKAIEKKLVSPTEAKSLSDSDLYDFLFHPGFSTIDKAGEYAGRGVGLDVVRTCMSEIRGVIGIDSNFGKGTTFTIRLPLTLSICKALFCLSNRARIAFPMDGVEDVLDISPDAIKTNSEGKSCIQWRDTLLPFQHLSDLLKYNRHLSRGNVYGKREDNLISIVVLRSVGNFTAIQVDQALGEQEIVIKQLEGPAPKPVGIAGATVLGDGRIMPIADVLELIDLAKGIRGGVTIWQREENSIPDAVEMTEAKSEPMVLIVDDSITVRSLLEITFTKSGYRVEQARDGQEAWEKLRSGLPCDVVFCDIEMPRMNGIELLSRLQKDEDLRHIPIAMLTSRGAQRHQQEAAKLGARGYFIKPYQDEVLLDAAQRMIKGEQLFGSSNS